MLPLGFVKCLLVLGGGTEVNKTGRLWISRMGHDEITSGEELVFARTSQRQWFVGAEEGEGNKTPSVGDDIYTAIQIYTAGTEGEL